MSQERQFYYRKKGKNKVRYKHMDNGNGITYTADRQDLQRCLQENTWLAVCSRVVLQIQPVRSINGWKRKAWGKWEETEAEETEAETEK